MDFNQYNGGMEEQSFGFAEPDMMEKKHKAHKKVSKGYEDKDEKESAHSKGKRTKVINFFKQEGVDNAPYAYKLWPEKSTDEEGRKNARSLFAKCLHGDLNDNGNPYSFDDDEINKLFSLMSSTMDIVSEGVKLNDAELKYVISEVRKILKENAINERYSYLNESWDDEIDTDFDPNAEEEEESFDYGNDGIDIATLSNILDKHGWGIINSEDVTDRSGNSGVRYVVASNGPHDDIQTAIQEIWGYVANPDMVRLSSCYKASAPEIKYPVIIVMD